MKENVRPPYEEINYEYEEGITQEVLPFAFTGGDKWVFIENGTTEPYIRRYYHPEDAGEYCAKNLEDAILLNIIEFASYSAIWLDKNGKIEKEYNSEQKR